MCVASEAIKNMGRRIRDEKYKSALLGGICANKPGYHNCRNALPSSDYSVQQADDKAGSGENCAALDITLHNVEDMKKITNRMISLTNSGDKRFQVIREFFGTTDGVNVTGRDVRTKKHITSDDSHLWHVHISVYRKYAGDKNALDDVADAILGISSSQPPPPEAPPEERTANEMFPVQDTEGAIYLAGPGVWKHLTPDEWGAWKRHLQPLSSPVNGVQRDWIKNNCLADYTPNSQAASVFAVEAESETLTGDTVTEDFEDTTAADAEEVPQRD